MPTHQVNRIQNGQVGPHVSPGWERQLKEYQRVVADSVRKNPVAATLVVFGVGFSIGAAIGSMLSDPREMRRQQLAKSLGRRMLNSVNDFIPDSLSIS